jgi:hypothetical protein
MAGAPRSRLAAMGAIARNDGEAWEGAPDQSWWEVSEEGAEAPSDY